MQPTAHDIGIWFLVASALLSAGSSAAVIFTSFRSQRRQVRMEESFATVPQLQELSGRVDDVDADVRALRESIVANGETRRKSIEGKVESLRLEMKGDVRELDEKVGDVNTQVARLASGTELMGTQITLMGAQINHLIERRNA